MSDDDDPDQPSGGRTQRRVVRDGYDRLATDYDAERSDTAAEPPLTTFLAGVATPARVLDVGCGGGRPVLTTLSAETDVDAVGLDFSLAQLSLAGEATDAPLVAGDMTRLPVADDAFDGLVAFHSIIHVPAPDHASVFREFARTLHPGGLALVSVGTDAWAGANDDWLDTGVRMEWSIPDLPTSRRHARDAGFDVVEEWTVDDELGGSFQFLLLEF